MCFYPLNFNFRVAVAATRLRLTAALSSVRSFGRLLLPRYMNQNSMNLLRFNGAFASFFFTPLNIYRFII